MAKGYRDGKPGSDASYQVNLRRGDVVLLDKLVTKFGNGAKLQTIAKYLAFMAHAPDALNLFVFGHVSEEDREAYANRVRDFLLRDPPPFLSDAEHDQPEPNSHPPAALPPSATARTPKQGRPHKRGLRPA